MTPQSSQPFRVSQIDHVELFVPERRAAAAWYERTLGLRIVAEYEFWADDPGGPLMISTADGQTKLALFVGEPQGQHESTGHRRVAFRVSGEYFLRFLDHIRANPVCDRRGEKLTWLSRVDHSKSWSVYFCDPWGNRYEVTTYDYDTVRETH
ncbi:MAG TPA: VOC family protein [candidate division Zixibacteria bacterium]|jgi:catechol 2,3-dioxygenase-like lactoylglutathione lyase family enzyme